MNADIKRYVVGKDGVPQLKSVDTVSVGEDISTKSVGSSRREDLTHTVSFDSTLVSNPYLPPSPSLSLSPSFSLVQAPRGQQAGEDSTLPWLRRAVQTELRRDIHNPKDKVQIWRGRSSEG